MIFTFSAVRSPMSRPCRRRRKLDDRFVHVVAGGADGAGVDHPAQRDHRDVGGAAADVDDHAAGRLGDRQPGADRGGHRLVDQVHFAGLGAVAAVDDGAALDLGDARRDADDQAVRRQVTLPWALRMRWLNRRSAASKSAITPSRRGRIVVMFAGVRPSMAWAACPTASVLSLCVLTATIDGSSTTIPRPGANTTVFAVPKSTAKSRAPNGRTLSSMTLLLDEPANRSLPAWQVACRVHQIRRFPRHAVQRCVVPTINLCRWLGRTALPEQRSRRRADRTVGEPSIG